MKIKVLKNDDHRLAPAIVQHFRAGSVVSVPKKTADALIARGSAQPATKHKDT